MIIYILLATEYLIVKYTATNFENHLCGLIWFEFLSLVNHFNFCNFQKLWDLDSEVLDIIPVEVIKRWSSNHIDR